jgi:alkylmercury lyase
VNEPLEIIRAALEGSISARVIPRQYLPAVVGIMRELSKGRALSVPAVAGVIGGSEVDATAMMNTLERMGLLELDESGDVVGMVISLRPTPHRLIVDGTTLYTWCAIDALFVPAILSKIMHVESVCPESGRTIRLRVGPSGVQRVDPPGVKVSLVAPGITKGLDASCCGVAGLTGVQGGFCGNVHFLASDGAAARWLKGHEGGLVVSVTEAFDLTRSIWTDPLLRRGT